MSSRSPHWIAVWTLLLMFAWTGDPVLRAQETSSPAASMIALLKGGRVPENRLMTIINLVCSRGNGDDLAYIFTQAAKPDGWPPAIREAALRGLLTATRERQTRPAGDHAPLLAILKSSSPALQSLAIELVGEWKLENAGEALAPLVTAPETSSDMRRKSLAALAALSPAQARDLISGLTASTQPLPLRFIGVEAAARLDGTLGAELAAKLLRELAPENDPSPIVVAFLDVKNGTEKLAAQLAPSPPSRDHARLMLREMLARGRSDVALNSLLTTAAGLNQTIAMPTPAEMAALQERILTQGNAARGELVFRRDDLSCLRCHAVSKSGGQVGPDLSSVGTVSPIEFLVASVLDPDQAIKEGFHTRTVVTKAGRIHQGLIHDRTQDALVLKDAAGQLQAIPIHDIDEEIEGKSLMPKGLVNFMTTAEFADLILFLSQLGRPGDYALRSTPTLQRYRLLVEPTEAQLKEFRAGEQLDAENLEAARWEPLAARVNGSLPLAELARKARNPQVVVFSEVQCTVPGEMELLVKSGSTLSLWLDEQPLTTGPRIVLPLTEVTHRIFVKTDSRSAAAYDFRLELKPIEGSPAKCVPVDGL